MLQSAAQARAVVQASPARPSAASRFDTDAISLLQPEILTNLDLAYEKKGPLKCVSPGVAGPSSAKWALCTFWAQDALTCTLL